MLSDEEEMGIRLLVLIRTGQLKGFNCSQCNEELQKRRNCNGENSEIPVAFYPTMGQFYICPLKAITSTIYDWAEQYDYYEKYPSAYTVSFKDCNPKWWSAVKLYEHLIEEYKAEEHKKMINSMKNKK